MSQDRKEYFRQYYLKRKQQNKSNVEPIREGIMHAIPTVKKKAFLNFFTKNAAVQIATISVLSLFIILNSIFLINEQLRFYVLSGYSLEYGLSIALLSELATIFLSVALAFELSSRKRFQIKTILLLTIASLLGTIVLGLARKEAKDETQNKIIELYQKEIDELDRTKDTSPSASKALLKKQAELRDYLIKSPVSIDNVARETFFMSFTRVMSILWNLVFSGLVGLLFKRFLNEL